jgi:peptidylprolyl isomerase
MLRRIVMAVAGAALLAGTAAAWAGPADDPANWRKVDGENLLQFTVNGQEILIELRPDIAPKHVEQIRKIVRDGNYDKLPFHRVIDDFMAQGGDVYSVYQIYPRYPNLPGEFTWMRDPGKQKVQWFGTTAEGDKLGYMDGIVVQGQPDEVAMISDPPAARTWAIHCAGVASMARSTSPDSAGTEFYLMRHARVGPGTPLDKGYTMWGRALTGLDVIRGIKVGPPDRDGRFMTPSQADKLTKAVIVADLKEHRRPSVYVKRTDGPEFAATLAAIKAADPVAACALPPVDVIVERPSP